MGKDPGSIDSATSAVDNNYIEKLQCNFVSEVKVERRLKLREAITTMHRRERRSTWSKIKS